MQKEKIHQSNLLLYFGLSLTVLVGFYFGEDSSGSGGFIADFKNTWPVLNLIEKKEYFNFSEYTVHFPLHYYILYFFNSIIENKDGVRFVFSLISLVVPYLFFLILKEKFSSISLNKLFFISQVIFLLPSFRSGAIWANTQISALIFFIISIIFYLKWFNSNSKVVNKYIIFQCIFLSLAVYSRQLYAIIFIFILYVYLIKLEFKSFIKVSIIIFFLSLPGIFFVFLSPRTLTTTFDFNLINTFIVNTSIISFYLIPIFLVYYLNSYKNLKIIENRKNDYLIIFFSSLLVILSSFYFNYNPSLGGGFFIKLSMLFFQNLHFFFFTSIIGSILILFIFKEDRNSIVLFILLIFGLSSYQIFQKYFEPMIIILLFSIIVFRPINIILSSYKNICIFKLYFLIYLFSAIINDIYKITKTFV